MQHIQTHNTIGFLCTLQQTFDLTSKGLISANVYAVGQSQMGFRLQPSKQFEDGGLQVFWRKDNLKGFGVIRRSFGIQTNKGNQKTKTISFLLSCLIYSKNNCFTSITPFFLMFSYLLSPVLCFGNLIIILIRANKFELWRFPTNWQMREIILSVVVQGIKTTF